MRTIVFGLLLVAVLGFYAAPTWAFADDAHHPGSDTATSPVSTGSMVMRVATGVDRYARAISLSRTSYSQGSVKHVVLVSGTAYTDGLSAAALAGAYRSPVLLTRSRSLPDGLVREMRRLGVSHVHVIGSTGQVSSSVTTALKSAGFHVQRIAGGDTFATSAAIARRVALVRGGTGPLRVFVVNPFDIGNAADTAGYAYATATPILYVRPGSVPDVVAAAIRDLDVSRAVVVGGASSVYPKTFDEIARRTTGPDVRVPGADRFETAHVLADYAIANGWASAQHVTVVNGVTSLSDAVIAAPLTGASRGVTLLATSDVLPYYSDHFIASKARAQSIKMVVIVGPTAAIGDTVRLKIDTAAAGSEMDMTLMMPHAAGSRMPN